MADQTTPPGGIPLTAQGAANDSEDKKVSEASLQQLTAEDKAAAVSALTGLDKKSFAEQVLAKTEKLAEQIAVQTPPNYGGTDVHLIKDEKLKEAAMSALEGDEWHEKRLEEEARAKLEERRRTLLKEKEEAEKEIIRIDREKEVFELQWINLNDEKQPLDAALQGIIDEEIRIEAEEKKKEQEEIAADTPEKRKEIEEIRWQLQQKRREIEEKKWAIQDKVSTLAAAMTALGDKYRELLSQEETRKRRIHEIESDIKNL